VNAVFRTAIPLEILDPFSNSTFSFLPINVGEGLYVIMEYQLIQLPGLEKDLLPDKFTDVLHQDIHKRDILFEHL